MNGFALASGSRRAETHVDQDGRFFRPSRNEVQGVASQSGPQGNAHVKKSGKKIRQSWPAARAVLKAADWELIALHMRAGLEDAGATAMFAGGIRAAADGLLAGLGRTGCSDIRVTADFAARGVRAAARCIVSMRVGDIMLAAAKAAGRKKRKEGLQWKSIPSRA